MPQPQDALRRSRRPCEVLAESGDKPAIFKKTLSPCEFGSPFEPTRVGPDRAAAPGLHPSRAAAMPEIMPVRQHTIRALELSGDTSAPDVGAGALGRRPASSADTA